MHRTALFMPPRFNDEDKTREAFLLHVILWALIAVSLLFLMYHLLFSLEIPKRVLAQVLCGVVVNAFLLMLVRRGCVRSASIIQIAAFWLFFSATAWSRSGVHHQAYQMGYPLVISIAGFLVGMRGALIMVGVTLLSGGLMVAAEDMSWWSFKAAESALNIWVVSALLFPVFAVLQYLAGRLLRKALVKSRMSQAQYRNLVEHLPQRIFIKDLNSVYLSCNAHYARDLGIQPEQIDGKNDFAFYPKELAEEYRADDRAVIAGEVPKDKEERYVLSGQDRWVHTIKVPYRDHQGRVTGVLGIFEDITDRKLVEDALRASEGRYTLISDNVSDSIWLMDLNFKMTWASRSVERNRGYSLDELRGLPLEELLAPASLEIVLKTISEELTPERLQQKDLDISKTMDLEFCRKDGSTYWNEVTIKLLRDQEGTPIGFLGVGRDIESRRMRQALRESEEKYRLFVEGADEGIILTQEGEIKYINPRAIEFIGYSHEEMLAKNILDFVYPDDRERLTQLYLSKLSGEDVPAGSSWRIIDKSGAVNWVQSRSTLLSWQGKPSLLTFLADITQQRHTEEALLASEEKYKNLFENAPVGYMEYDDEGHITKVNRREVEMLGYTAEEMVGEPAWNFVIEKEKGQELIKAKLAGDKPPSKNLERTYRRKDGTTFPGLIEDAIFKDETGRIMGIRSTIQDITDRKRAEEEVRASEEKLKAAFEGSHDAVTITTKGGQFLDCNQRALEMFGLAGKEGFKGRRPADFSPDYQPDGRKSVEAALEHVNKALRERFSHFEWLHQRSTGETFPTEITLTSYQLRGEMVLQATIRDISDRKKAEEEKDKLQAQLNQAQKMESIGRLAGGVAHDFNNMLGIIIGNAELAALRVDPADPLHQSLQEILKASQRSADTVRQLLAFARKQTTSPKVLDLNDTVSGMLKMLQRLIGEDIDLAWVPGHGLWPVKIDPSQVNQILANLAVNARDAIAGVGRVTIKTDNVTLDEGYCADHKGFLPGQYVLLSVSDTGKGMPKEVLEHLFEPFFTTKGVGKGTGLGLSTIYGIVKQNNGFVNVYSELDQGTTCEIYLPRLQSGPLETEVKREPETLPRGTETVLMVEDEDAILGIGKAMLEELGYRVLTATTPGEAIQVVEKQGREIHLLVTDVVMPEMNGRDLADHLKAINPGLKCLYMSGYTANVIAHHGVLDEGVVFIQKPFSTRELAVKVREVLDKE